MIYKSITAATLAAMMLATGTTTLTNTEPDAREPEIQNIEQNESSGAQDLQNMPNQPDFQNTGMFGEKPEFRPQNGGIQASEEKVEPQRENFQYGQNPNEERPEQPPQNGGEMTGQGEFRPNGQLPEMNERTNEKDDELPPELPDSESLDDARPEVENPGEVMEPNEKHSEEGEQKERPFDFQNEDIKNNEEAKTIISQIQDLFKKLMSLFNRNDSNQSDNKDNGNSFQEMSHNDGRPSESMNDNEERNQPDGQRPEMGGSSAPESYEAANTVTESSSNQAYTSANDNENAVLVSGDKVTLSDSTIFKTGSASGENADFYGTNAAVLATDGANLTLSGITVNTDGTHANAVFSYGSGTSVEIADSAITTTGNNSGGLMVTGGGSITATNLEVETSGNSSAAIRSDRGGGTANVTEGSYSTSGVGSPAIYSTADIKVNDATLSASNSEAVVIEGGNSVTLTDCTVTGNDASLNGQSTVKTNVLIYQSMSGDASEGSSTFTMSGGTLTSLTGAMFHVTNVTTTINLSNVTLNYASDSNVFLDASADSWGTSGKNGGYVTLNLDDQDITGIITCDSVSGVTVNMTNGSTWTLTGDSHITSLTGDTSGINLNGYKLYVNGVLYTE